MEMGGGGGVYGVMRGAAVTSTDNKPVQGNKIKGLGKKKQACNEAIAFYDPSDIMTVMLIPLELALKDSLGLKDWRSGWEEKMMLYCKVEGWLVFLWLLVMNDHDFDLYICDGSILGDATC